MSVRGEFVFCKTGEVLTGKFTSQEEMERYQKYLELSEKNKAKDYWYKVINEMKGSFVMLLYNIQEALDYGIKPANLTRLIFLSTYLNYNDNHLINDEQYISKNVLKSIMNLPRKTFDRFYDDLIQVNILSVDDDGFYMLDTDKFVKGCLSKDIRKSKHIMQIYERSIRSLYRNVKYTDHKFLSYLFQAIPYVNIQKNVICKNPQETVLNKVLPMTLHEYLDTIGYNSHNAQRFINTVIKFKVDNKPVFNFVKNGCGDFIFINPQVYYGGSEWDSIRVLGEFVTQEEADDDFSQAIRKTKRLDKIEILNL